MEKQTIVAPMTPNGVSAVAAIRVSGPQVKSVVKTLFGERPWLGLNPTWQNWVQPSGQLLLKVDAVPGL